MNTQSLLEKTIQLKRRRSSTIPFGYELSEDDSQYLEPVEKQLDALQAVEEMIVNEEISLRDGCYWHKRRKTCQILNLIRKKETITITQKLKQR